MSKKNGSKRDPNQRLRKLAEREEIIEVKLTPMQMEDLRATVLDLLDEEESIEERLAEVKKNFTSQLNTNRLQINEHRRTISAGKRRETIQVEEYLTASNEVVRIRKDTGEQIGARTATPRELQEELPLEPQAPDNAQQNDAPEEDATEAEEAFASVPD